MSLRRRWFRFWSRRDVDGDLEAEIAFHLERTIARLVDAGWSLPDAEREAYRRFGDVDRYRRRLRRLDEGRWNMQLRREWLGNLIRDLRYAGRTLRREPALAIGISLTFALGIGANTTMFGILDRLLLSGPAHVRDVGRLRRILVRVEYDGGSYTRSAHEYADYQDVQRVAAFESVAAYSIRQMTLGFGDDARHLDVGIASASLFPTLGVDAARGRFYSPLEDRPGGDPVVVLGNEFWRSRFGGDEDVVGHTVVLDEQEYVVVGVAPRGFTGADLARVDAWAPLQVAGRRLYPDRVFGRPAPGQPRIRWLQVIARVRRDAAVDAAEAQARTIYAAAHADDQRRKSTLTTASIIAGRGPLASDESRVSLWLGGVALIVLLVACANVANMLMARGIRRQAEIGVRLALGVPRSRLVRQLLIEGVLLALLGGGAALLLTRLGGGIVRRTLLPDVVWSGASPAGQLLEVTTAIALLTGLLAGILPAVRWSRQDVMATLRSGALDGRRSRVRAFLLIVQAALSMLLLTGAGLFVRSLHEVTNLDMGLYDPASIVVVEPELGAAAENATGLRWPDETILARLRAHPAVAAAAESIATPFGSHWAVGVALPGRDATELRQLIDSGPYIHPVSDGYFESLGLRILRGRGIDERDGADTTPVVVVNETMARALWPGEPALGKCLLIDQRPGEPAPPCTTVVGVVENAKRNSVQEGPQVQFYVPIDQHRLSDTSAFMVRLRPGVPAADVIRSIRTEVIEAAPDDIRFVNAYTLQERIEPQTRSWRLGATMFTAFGVLAGLVAAIGLYGVLAFDVARRTRELGVRAALGATAGSLRLLVLRRGVRLSAAGVGLGTLLALAVSSRIESLLFRVSPRDPEVLLGVALLLLATAAAASWLPASRATRVDPNRALRHE